MRHVRFHIRPRHKNSFRSELSMSSDHRIFGVDTVKANHIHRQSEIGTNPVPIVNPSPFPPLMPPHLEDQPCNKATAPKAPIFRYDKYFTPCWTPSKSNVDSPSCLNEIHTQMPKVRKDIIFRMKPLFKFLGWNHNHYYRVGHLICRKDLQRLAHLVKQGPGRTRQKC